MEKKRTTMANQADKHVLYEKAVQCVEAEVDFIDTTFKKLRHRAAKTIREDFCGTTNTSCEWVKRRDNNIAYCIDIDPTVLDWGCKNKVSRLSKKQKNRINIINSDVMKTNAPAVDAILAMNFSYWVFKNRQLMTKYFRKVRKSLVADGIFFLDAFGGYEAFQVMQESTKQDGFTYIWDQSHYNPITGQGIFHIHFKFKDGSRIRNAFTYDWRVWTLPELTEMLSDAGFKPAVYWEGTGKDGQGNGIYKPSTEGEADAGWVAYIVAEK